MRSGLPIGVHQLLDPERVEGIRVEYKASWDDQTELSALQTICAFANDLRDVNGGYLVVGVEAKDGLPVLPPRGIPAGELDRLQIRIAGKIKGAIRPDYRPSIFVEQVDGKHILIVQCHPGDDRPYWMEGRNKKPEHFARVTSETQAATGELIRQLQEVSTRRPFDDRPCFEAHVEDLDPALVFAHLLSAGSDLVNSREDFADRARRLDLLHRVNGHEVPRNVALLFFSERPRRFFRGAAIEVALMPQGRGGDEIIAQTIEGPLPTMIRTALQHVRGLLPTMIRKHPAVAEAEHAVAWPFQAIEEALVNAVHHRSYEATWPDPIQVIVLPEAIEIISYPGPMPGLTLADVREGRPRPVSARNRRIADLLKQERLAERLGTGLGKIRRVMYENGSPPPEFDFDEEARSSFLVRLPIHPAFRLRGATQRPAQRPRPGRPASPAELVGREGLLARIRATLEHQSVLLVGPRGRGISSVLGALAERERAFLLDVARVDGQGFESAFLTWVEERSGLGQGAARDLDSAIQKLGPETLWILLDNFDVSDDSLSLEDRDDRHHRALRLTGRHSHLRLVAAVTGPEFEVTEEVEALSTELQSIIVPPLERSAAVELASRLLLGVELPDDPAEAETLADLSAGLPELLVRMVVRLGTDGAVTQEGAVRALDELVSGRRDPTGLRARVHRAQNGDLGASVRKMGGHETILDLVAASPEGRPRLELIATTVTQGIPRVRVLDALNALLLDGWLVEVDGVIRFEHPWVRDAWQHYRARPSGPPYDDQDIPF